MACCKRTLLILTAAATLLLPGGVASAQEARWAPRNVEVTGRSEASGCAAARTQVAAEARKYLGLNIRECTCRAIASKGNGPSAGYRCRLTYEVLVRMSSR